MADTLFIVPVQMWVYSMVYTTAIRFWLADRALLLAGLMIQAITDWLVTSLFGPAISDFALLSQGLMPAFFTIAVFLLAMGYLAAPFFKVRVVSMGKAIGWLLFALLFYQIGPGLYVEGEGVRRALSSEFYGAVLEQANSAPTGGGTMAILDDIAAGPDDAMGALDNQFGAFIPSDRYVDGLDLAMAYTLSRGDDVVYALDLLPEDFSAEYFDPAQGAIFFMVMSPQQRTDSINAGLTGISRLLLATIIIVFGLFEQAIYLWLSIAAGILFVSMSVAILFAFFERTELIARTLIDQWLELFILSVVIAVIQAFVVGLVTVGARTLNPTLTLGASLLGAIIMVVLQIKALGAIKDALNRMFQAISQSVGGGLMTPGEAVKGAAGLALTVASAGAGAAVALGAGAGMAQVAGSALSGMDSLYSTAALGSFILPEGSKLKGTAQGFYEGALSNRMLGPLGGLMLKDGGMARKSDAAETPPTAGSDTKPAAATGNAPTQTTAPTETDIRLDAADLVSLRDAVSTAMAQALLAAPHGGYSSPDQALAAVRSALSATPAGSDPRMGDYLDRRAAPIASHILLTSQGKGPVDEKANAPQHSDKKA